MTGDADMPVLVTIPVYLRPRPKAGRRRRGCGDPPVDAVDQIELPGSTLDLPYAQADQQYLTQHDSQGEENGPQRPRRRPSTAFSWDRVNGTAPMAVIGAHGIWLMSGLSIISALRWYITQSEPDSTMPTTMTVKIRDIIVHPLSDLLFM